MCGVLDVVVCVLEIGLVGKCVVVEYCSCVLVVVCGRPCLLASYCGGLLWLLLCFGYCVVIVKMRIILNSIIIANENHSQ